MTEVTKASFGATPDGRLVDVWTLRAGGYAAQVLTYGGILRSLTVPAPGGSRDIVLGCETLEDYEKQDKYFGALVGRVANRIGGAAFELNGKSYPLAANSGPNCLHGGVRGFNQAVWQAREVDGSLVLTHVSPDGDEGFPGTLEVRVTYSLTADGVLRLDYWAKSDADTLCNLTNHSYFNLLGHDAGTLAGQQVEIFADAIDLLLSETEAGALIRGRIQAEARIRPEEWGGAVGLLSLEAEFLLHLVHRRAALLVHGVVFLAHSIGAVITQGGCQLSMFPHRIPVQGRAAARIGELQRKCLTGTQYLFHGLTP